MPTKPLVKFLMISLTIAVSCAWQPHEKGNWQQNPRRHEQNNSESWFRTGLRRMVADFREMYEKDLKSQRKKMNELPQSLRESTDDLTIQIMERRPIPAGYDPVLDPHGDCLHKERGTLREYPSSNDCYSRVYNDNNQDLWWSLFAEIGGDLRYAFDFVLWDKYFPTKKENQFWYLMLYLKTLAKTIKNQEEIVSMSFYQEKKDKLDKQMSIINEYSAQNEGQKNMMDKLSDISASMGLYQADMRMLEGKLNEVFATVAHVQAHKGMLHSKLSDLDLKTTFIKSLIDKLNKESGEQQS